MSGVDRRRDCGGRATARRSCSPARVDRVSASMRRTCCSSTAGVFSLPAIGRVEQFVIRNAAPEEEGQARGEFQIADAIRACSGATPAGSCSTRNRNSGLTSTARSAISMPASKPPSLARFADRTSAGAARSASVTGRRYARRIRVDENAFGAGVFVGRALRLADEECAGGSAYRRALARRTDR